jgi:hypothetical protein
MPSVLGVTRAQWRERVRRQRPYHAIDSLLLNIADQEIHRALTTAFKNRRERFRQWMPHIELDGSNA